MVKQALVTTALAMTVGWLIFCIPLVRLLVWLNAAEVSAYFHAPGLFVPLGYLGILAIMGLIWGLFWYSYRLLKEIKRV